MRLKDLVLSPAVQSALAGHKPVLALESTIITHGMPWPDNLETAREVEQVVREAGAEPATIAILDGALRVGLDDEGLQQLARRGTQAVKCSRRDLPFVLESGQAGATTVAATMLIAHRAGIKVFATGGIGGVHRGAARSLDVSADLQELAQTPVAVICAGPKAILDIPMTLEYLETHGVPVVGFQTDELPAFYSRESGHSVDYRLESAAAIARVMDRQWSLGLDAGLIIANPAPKRFALPGDRVEQAVSQALNEAGDRGVTGKAVTPFLLERVASITGGDSLSANKALIRNNARLGAEIALEFCSQQN